MRNYTEFSVTLRRYVAGGSGTSLFQHAALIIHNFITP